MRLVYHHWYLPTHTHTHGGALRVWSVRFSNISNNSMAVTCCTTQSRIRLHQAINFCPWYRMQAASFSCFQMDVYGFFVMQHIFAFVREYRECFVMPSAIFSFCLGHFAFSFAFSKLSTCSFEFRSGDCKTFLTVFTLKKYFYSVAAFKVWFWLWDQTHGVWSIWLNLRSFYSSLYLRIHLAAFVSDHIII